MISSKKSLIAFAVAVSLGTSLAFAAPSGESTAAPTTQVAQQPTQTNGTTEQMGASHSSNQSTAPSVQTPASSSSAQPQTSSATNSTVNTLAAPSTAPSTSTATTTTPTSPSATVNQAPPAPQAMTQNNIPNNSPNAPAVASPQPTTPVAAPASTTTTTAAQPTAPTSTPTAAPSANNPPAQTVTPATNSTTPSSNTTTAPANGTNKPVMTPEASIDNKTLISFSQQAAQAAFTYSYDNVQDNLKKLQTFFTPNGWTSFNKALTASNNLKVVEQEKLNVTAKVAGESKVSNHQQTAQGQQWHVDVPLQVTYANAKQQKVEQSLMIKLVLATVNTDVNNHGVAIKQFIATPASNNPTTKEK